MFGCIARLLGGGRQFRSANRATAILKPLARDALLPAAAVEIRKPPVSAPPAWVSVLPARFVVVDVETTGLHGSDRIVSLAALRVETAGLLTGNLNIKTEHLIFNPGKKCHPEAARIHGHDDWTLRHQPFFGEHASAVRELLDATELVVAHNARFDLSFVNRELAAAGCAPVAATTYCTMENYRRLHDGRANLNAVAGRLGLARLDKQHGALEDAWLTMNVYLWLHGCPTPISFARVPLHARAFTNRRPVPPMPSTGIRP